MSINSLMIPCVESQYTQEYIANVFWRQHIAKVSSITLIPYLKNGEIYNIAYITIYNWCDSEAAYNFIHRVQNPYKEARIVHHDDNWWPIQLNTHNNGDIKVGTYTVDFDSSYFKKVEYDTDSCSDYEFSIDEQIDFETELRIQNALQNSQNVTLRPGQQAFIQKPKLIRQVNYY